MRVRPPSSLRPLLVRPTLLLAFALLLLAALPMPAHGGIYGFWKWFRGHYKEVVSKVGSEQFAEFDHVLIDVNQLTHMAARKARDEEHAIKRLLKEIARTLRVLRPKKSVVIAFDGPAPLAKIITQRKRRSSEKELNTPINSLHLSPGTAFMRRAADAIVDFCHNRSSSSSAADSFPRKNVRYYISGSECPGEGEVKLMDWINTHVLHPGGAAAEPLPEAGGGKKKGGGKGGSKGQPPQESLVVVGGDADLVLQGLALPGLPDFNVYIPDVKRSGYFVSLRQFVARLEKDFPGQSHQVRNDMVLLLVMAGNDYLKKVRGLTFRNKLMAYANTKRRPEFRDQFMLVPADRTFNWPFLKAFYEDLAGRSYVEDINLLTRGPTPAAVLNELAQKKLVPPFFLEFDGEGVTWTVTLRMGDKLYEIDEPMRSMKAAKQAICEMVLKDVAPEQYAAFFPPPSEDDEEGDGEEDEDERERYIDGVGRHEEYDEEEEEEEEATYNVRQRESGEEENDENAIVDWRHEEKLFDEEHYLTGLLWNVQMYIDGYCPDYQFAYRYRFAPSARCLADWIGNATASDPSFRLDVPVSHEPPLHAALACLAVMPRWGLHLVPENLSAVLADFPRVDSMYDTGAPFSLDVLIEAVNAARPDLIRSQHFYWTEIAPPHPPTASGRKSSSSAAKSKQSEQGEGEMEEEGATAEETSSDAARARARRVMATSAPPLRPWEKAPHTKQHIASLPSAGKRWREKRPFPSGAAGSQNPSSPSAYNRARSQQQPGEGEGEAPPTSSLTKGRARKASSAPETDAAPSEAAAPKRGRPKSTGGGGFGGGAKDGSGGSSKKKGSGGSGGGGPKAKTGGGGGGRKKEEPEEDASSVPDAVLAPPPLPTLGRRGRPPATAAASLLDGGIVPGEPVADSSSSTGGGLFDGLGDDSKPRRRGRPPKRAAPQASMALLWVTAASAAASAAATTLGMPGARRLALRSCAPGRFLPCGRLPRF